MERWNNVKMEGGFVECKQIPGRGRGLVSTKQLRAGQVVLQEAPIVIYADAGGALKFCGSCLRMCPGSSACSGCRSTIFCSTQCSSRHSKELCHALARLAKEGLDSDLETQARFLLAAYHVALVSPSEFDRVMLLEGEGEGEGEEEAVRKVFGVVEEAVLGWDWKGGEGTVVSREVAAALLSKDARNGFGIMAPCDAPGERRVRGFALYPCASFINHDCLPNSCRFDYIDKPGDSNTHIFIRAMHDISEGKEITISYFPINWPYKERQKRCEDEYGFKCTCERCSVEQNWSEGESEGEDVSSENEAGDECSDSEDFTTAKTSNKSSADHEIAADDEEDTDDFEHAMFFVKYLCPRENCGGTMAPLPPDSPADQAPDSEVDSEFLVTMECNMCSTLRTGEEFRKDMEENGMLG